MAYEGEVDVLVRCVGIQGTRSQSSYLIQRILIHLGQLLMLHIRLLERSDPGVRSIERALHGGQGRRIGVSWEGHLA